MRPAFRSLLPAAPAELNIVGDGTPFRATVGTHSSPPCISWHIFSGVPRVSGASGALALPLRVFGTPAAGVVPSFCGPPAAGYLDLCTCTAQARPDGTKGSLRRDNADPVRAQAVPLPSAILRVRRRSWRWPGFRGCDQASYCLHGRTTTT